MATQSGKAGKVLIGETVITEVTSHSLNPTSNNPSYASSSTGGYKTRRAGVKDATGSISGKYDVANPIEDYLMPGTKVTLDLYFDDGNYWRVPAIIDDLQLNDDIDDGAILDWTASFGITGAWTALAASS